MKVFFCRVGGKTKIRKQIIELIPKHKIYVEPFVGGGAVFFGKPKSEIEILNDKDIDVADMFRDIKTINPSDIKQFSFYPDKNRFTNYVNTRPLDPIKRLERNLYIRFNSFSGNCRSYHSDIKKYNPNNRGSYIKRNALKYKTRLSDVKIYNNDFVFLIQKYDDKDTFFYFDPPYSKQDKSWGYKHLISVNDVFNAIKNLKGKFILSYDDTDEVRQIFSKYFITSIKTKYNVGNSNGKIGHEVLITNYAV